MKTNSVNYYFIDSNSNYYADAVKLRHDVFYKPSSVGMEGVFDSIENKSEHLVAIVNNNVVGYIRLTIDGDKAQISQFVVDKKMRGKLMIAQGLIERIIKKAKENFVHELWGEIRLHVAESAKIYGFEVSNEVFLSKKTGIPHKRIKKII